MNFTPLKKGFLPSSTPIQSLGDSGYFGSDNKSFITKAVHTLSPVKECLPSKKRYTLAQLGRTYSLETPQNFKVPNNVCPEETRCISNELAKELDFNDLSEFSECLDDSGIRDNKNIDCNQFPSFYIEDFSLPKFEAKKLTDVEVERNWLNSICNNRDALLSPINKVKENDLFKNRKVDFFEKLSRINCNFIISSVLASLSPDDLCRVCCVNKKWKNVVVHDIKANRRRKEFLKEERSCKENQPCNAALEADRQTKQTLAGERKTVLCDVINTTTFKQPLEKNTSKFGSFIKEGQNMKSGTLMKCPSCEYAARKAGDTDEYCCTKCNYTFCQKCLNPFLENHSCNKLKVSIVIGSKRSKKSLKRL